MTNLNVGSDGRGRVTLGFHPPAIARNAANQCAITQKGREKREQKKTRKKKKKRRKIIPCPAIRNSHPPLPHLIQFPIPQPTKMLLPPEPELAGKQQRRPEST